MANHRLSAATSEASFETKIIDYATLRQWMCHAERPARTQAGWRTPIRGHRGYPDLTLARRGAIVFAELKAEGAPIPPHQTAWLTALQGAPVGVEGRDYAGRFLTDELGNVKPWIGHLAVLWRPSDWPTIERILR